MVKVDGVLAGAHVFCLQDRGGVDGILDRAVKGGVVELFRLVDPSIKGLGLKVSRLKL